MKGNVGLIDTTGKRIVAAIFEDVGEVSDDLIAIKKRGKWGFCSYDVQLKIAYNYEDVTGFYGEYAIVRKEKHYGVINKKGVEIIEEEKSKEQIIEELSNSAKRNITKKYLKEYL